MTADTRPTPTKYHFSIDEQQLLENKIQRLLKLLKNFYQTYAKQNILPLIDLLIHFTS